MDKIRCRSDRRICIDSDEADLKYEINYVLKLNGDLDQEGNMRSDTSSSLVYGRRQVYGQFVRYITELGKQNKLSVRVIQRKIDELCPATEYREYVGVMLYFLRRKIRQVAG